MESLTLPNILFFFALGLLIIASGGIAYLTALDWRDRRRREQDKKTGR